MANICTPKQFLLTVFALAAEYTLRGNAKVRVHALYGPIPVSLSLTGIKNGVWSVGKPPTLVSRHIQEVEAHLKRIAA